MAPRPGGTYMDTVYCDLYCCCSRRFSGCARSALEHTARVHCAAAQTAYYVAYRSSGYSAETMSKRNSKPVQLSV
eukprot:20434-Heterococcus_DN1.PRE.2